MNLIDIHAHLEHEKFQNDLDNVIKNAEKAGVKCIINSGVNPETNRKSLELSEKYKIIKTSLGLYPLDALAKEIEHSSENQKFLREYKEFNVDEEIEWIIKNKEKCVAVGECGLDYFWINTEESRIKQKQIFQKIIEMVEKIKKPIIIHSRKAEHDAVEMLESSSIKNVIMHCFCARKSLIKQAAENNWFFSIPPIIKRLQHFQMMSEIVDINQLLTETDAPCLSHIAGERNEPANVAVTIEEIAKIKNMKQDDVAERIWENSRKLFKF